MRRWIALFLVMFLVLSFGGCGDDTSVKDRDKDRITNGKTDSFEQTKENAKKWAINELRGHYVNPEASPAMSSDGPKADVSEAYFTANSHLCVELLISNGADRMVNVEAIDVAVYNYETDELIAGGKAALPEDLIVEVAGVQAYTFYISPEHIHVDETTPLPEVIYFEISIDSVPVEAE